MRKLLLLFSLLSLCAYLPPGAMAQNKIVSGSVIAQDDKMALPGVNVLIKGTTNGTITDGEGKFQLNIPSDNSILVFSFVGFKTKEIAVNNQSTIEVALETESTMLDDIVVTSFGVEKEKKELGYSIQEVAGKDLAETSRPNVITSLQGRVAGVNVTNTTGLPGSSSSIVIRGGTSLDGNNQPLFVVDGVPIDNTTFDGGSLFSDTPNRNFDYTSRAMDISPEDIESVTVLKGPSAAALYGIDAANGAIIITTKKGKKGKASIVYNNDFRFERNTRFHETYNGYNQGSEGVDNELNLRQWGAKTPEGTPIYNNAENFFGTGFAQSHDISISGGNDNITYRASGSLLDQNGSVENTGYDRNSIRLNISANPFEKLTFNGSASYIRSEAARAAKGAGSFYQFALLWPGQLNMQDSDDPLVLDGDAIDNPYYSVNNNSITDETDRTLLNGSVNYEFTDWLSATGRIGLDMYNSYGLTAYDAESYQKYPNRSTAQAVGGLMAEYNARSRLMNSFILLTAQKKFGDINTTLTLGNSVEDKNYRVDSRYGEDIKVPDFYSIINTDPNTREVSVKGYRRRLVSVFGEFKADYKNMLFLTVTGRNDWSSTLPKQNNSFFYPSVSTSFVFSEALNMEGGVFTFGKLRGSIAQVGKDAPTHQTSPALNEFTRTGGGFQVSVFGANENIMPETTTSYEVGMDLRFFNNRLGLDMTYYNVRSKDQIVTPRLSYVSGYILQLVNAGEIENQGLEIMLTGDVIKSKDLMWDVTANFALNRNKVISLPGDFDEFYLSDSWLYGNARGGYIPGESYYSITGYSWERNEEGQLIIGDDGYPVLNNSFDMIGNRQPDFTLGLTNRFSYKNFIFSFLLDIKKGGDVYNATSRYLTSYGKSELTAVRGTTKVFEGVTESGEVNTQEVVLDQDYFTSGALGLVEENFIERDINWLRLRDVTLSYTLPKSILGNSFIKSLQLHVTGNNLFLISNYSGPDPDVNGLNASARGSSAGGFDYFSLPSPKVISTGLKINF
ncbi:SusC/RagA family TonB-linked outer membrane protein [Flexithrix dorotheae]|uniref:SusC/RagA family TonB-linked outer membrane protein n=1 Tax=Flexithrix dorotheae TaxID=70993 RepID=UPI00037379AF|nr:SusC/RagA family TonB-linked outer membrane protein [Flexithrix dorotheae]